MGVKSEKAAGFHEGYGSTEKELEILEYIGLETIENYLKRDGIGRVIGEAEKLPLPKEGYRRLYKVPFKPEVAVQDYHDICHVHAVPGTKRKFPESDLEKAVARKGVLTKEVN